MKLPDVTLSRAAALLTLTTLLTACSDQTPGRASESAPAAGLVPLILRSSNLIAAPGAALKPQGIPFNEDGTPAVTSVQVRVYDQRHTLIKFTADNVERADGPREYIELTPGASTANVQLTPGTYSFGASGLTASTGGLQLAHNSLVTQEVTSATPTVVTLALKTIIGKVSLEPVLPMNYVVPGQIFDVKLKVETDEVGSARYPVPLADFDLASASSPYGTLGLTVLSSSKLGSRVQVTGTGSSATLAQEIRGCLGVDAYDNLFCDRTFARITFPVYAAATIGADLERPTLTLSQPHYDQHSGPFVDGHVDDNVGIAKLQVYDGVLLIASTDAAEYGGDVQQIMLSSKTSGGPNTEWRAPIQFNINGETHTLTAVAQDTSGNETRVTELVNAKTIPTVTLAERSLDIYHKHTGTLHATFANFPAGPVQLSLEAVTNPGVPSGPPPLVLQTTTVTLDASGAQTRDVVIGAPDPVNLFTTYPQATFVLIASVNGQPVTPTAVTLKELPINFTASINPSSLTGRGGDVKTAVVTVTADPPLDGPVTLSPTLLLNEYKTHITNVGPTTGTGASMQATISFTFDQNVSATDISYSQPLGIRVAGITTGYRDDFYGSNPETNMNFTVQP